MIKTFYTKRRPPKVFFKSGLGVRSTAFGEGVTEEYLVWRKSFLERREREGEKFTLFAQGSVEGAETGLRAGIPKLSLDGVTFETTADGKLSLNGRRVQCDIGAEIKTWAIGCYEDGNFLFVIGKAEGKTSLRAYPVLQGGTVGAAASAVTLPATLDSSSTLTAFGRHLFLIHNATLFYCYFAPKTHDLERVAIGGEEDADADLFKLVRSPIVSDGNGNVFWIREEDVYGIRLGAPAALMRIAGSKLYKVTGLHCAQNTLSVRLKSKSGSQESTERYLTDGCGSITRAAN